MHVWGDPDWNAVRQLQTCLRHPKAITGALMADHHVGYAMPIGGVIAYDNAISPSGVGYDIGCGNKAVRLVGAVTWNGGALEDIADEIQSSIAFGMGRTNAHDVPRQWSTPVSLPGHGWTTLRDHDAWNIPFVATLKDMARSQLGTVGSGNHYVDVFRDAKGSTWIGVHFGSRGLGHKIATHYIKAGGGRDGMYVDPVVLDLDTELGKEYLLAMELAGLYAYAGRDWVCEQVTKIIGGEIVEEIHNHHNYAWYENEAWIIRKGATPAYPGQRGFVGATMGEPSVILEGKEHAEADLALRSTIHGAGRVLSRKRAKQEITQEDMSEWVEGRSGVVLRGGGLDEAPQAYKRLGSVLEAHRHTVDVTDKLWPHIVVMAGKDTRDYYRD